MRRWMGALRRFELCAAGCAALGFAPLDGSVKPRYHRNIQNHQYFSTAISFEIIELFQILKCKKLFFYILKA